MATTKGPRGADPGRSTAGGAPSTAGFNPWNPDNRATDSLLGRLNISRTTERAPLAGSPSAGPRPKGPKPFDAEVVRQVRVQLYQMMTDMGPGKDEKIENERAWYTEKVAEAIGHVLTERDLKLPNETIVKIRDDILEGILGFGPLQKLLEDPDVTEIMVNGPSKVFVEKAGRLYLSEITFSSEETLRQVIEKIVIPLGRRVDETSPMTDARLPDGSRVNIVIRPLALSGSTITVRKFQKIPLKLSSLVSAGTLTREMSVFLEGCVRSKLNIVVSGETGSGKTTTLNALSSFLPLDARIVTIEDSAELQLQQDHVVQLEARQANVEGRGEVTIRDLLRNALHMIPDRIIVGECRGGEALDMLNAMSSGNDGSMTTGHANTPRDLIGRIETMVMMAGMGLPSRAIREQIASAVQLIVHQARGKDGVRRITSIAEIGGIKDGNVQVNEIFRFETQGIDPETGRTIGSHVATGLIPKCLGRLLMDDFFVPDGTFGPSVSIESIRDEMRQREEDERRSEEARSKAKIVMQTALEKPQEEEETTSYGSVFHWRQAFGADSSEEASTTGAALPAAASHRDRLRELTKQLSERRKSLLSRTAKDDEEQVLVEEMRDLVLEALPSAGSFEELEKTYASIEEERRVMKTRVDRALDAILVEEKIELSAQLRKRVVDEVLNNVVGLGPLQALVEDAEISEIMVNGPDRIFVERSGKLMLTEVKFKEEAHLRHIVSQILRPIGRRVDETSPMVDARLRDGSRVNIVVPPIALPGTCITIRKFAKDPYSVRDLVSFGTLTPDVAAFLHACVKIRLNMVISGSTGSGKTTTLNAISGYIPDETRIVTVEDAAELQLQQEHILPLEARQPNIEGKGAITIRQLVMNALHMRPDRIIVGECRGGEALDMLMAMNTGHDGSLTTLHSNSPYDTILRLQTLVMLSGMSLPLRAINEQIAGAIQLIIHQDRLSDGKRRITHITELAGFVDDKPHLLDIFKWIPQGIGPKEAHLGTLEPTGHIPSFFNRFVEDNVELPQLVFGPSIDVDELFTRLQHEQRKRAQEERRRLLKLAREEEAKLEAEIHAANVALAPEELDVTTASGAPARPGPTGPASAHLRSKIFTWMDAVRAEDQAETAAVPTVHNERRWQLFKKLRSLSKERSSRRVEADQFEQARVVLTQAVAKELETVAIPDDFTSVASERVFMATLIASVLQRVRSKEGFFVEKAQEDALQYRVLSEFCGFGPIQQLMDDAEISEIMVNGPKRIFIERKGRVVLSDVTFDEDAQVVAILQRMLGPVSRRCDIASPMVDARLHDGSRINAVIAPLAISGSTITIRKFARDPYTIEMLTDMGTLSPHMAAFVKATVQARLNVVVSGGTGSGKTTTLNAISAFIPENERIISIEDTAELQLQQDHVVQLESRPPSLEGTGAITIRDLVKNALHMRPERIVVGECRGGEALDMLQAMATGQAGSLTTAHANTPRELVGRLEVMVMMAGTGLSMASIRDQITSTVDIVIQQQRFKDGTRKVTHISEVTGMTPSGEVELVDIFHFETQGVSPDGKIVGEFKATGYIPRCIRAFHAANFALPDDIFGPGTSVGREYDRIDRQRKIEREREKNLERMRYRTEAPATRPSAGGAGQTEEVSVASELAKRRSARATMQRVMAEGGAGEATGGDEGIRPGEELAIAGEMRERIATNEAQAAERPATPVDLHLNHLDSPEESTPSAGRQIDLKSQLRSRTTSEPALLRRLRKNKRDQDGD